MTNNEKLSNAIVKMNKASDAYDEASQIKEDCRSELYDAEEKVRIIKNEIKETERSEDYLKEEALKKEIIHKRFINCSGFDFCDSKAYVRSVINRTNESPASEYYKAFLSSTDKNIIFALCHIKTESEIKSILNQLKKREFNSGLFFSIGSSIMDNNYITY